MRALHERHIERNRDLRQSRTVEVEFERVVAGLPVDVDRASKRGGLGVVEPVKVRLPRIEAALDDDVAAAALLPRLARGHETRCDEVIA